MATDRELALSRFASEDKLQAGSQLCQIANNWMLAKCEVGFHRIYWLPNVSKVDQARQQVATGCWRIARLGLEFDNPLDAIE